MKMLRRIAPLVLVLCLLMTIAPAAGALTLEPSGYELDVSDYAPTQSTETGAIGGNYHLFTFDDFFDLAGGQYEAYRDAVNWWLSCGVTNGGETWDRFGVEQDFARYDLAFFLYRFYNITNDDGLWLYDDFSHNPLAGDTNWKFTDAVYACRWSGVLGAYEGNNFAPLRTTDAATVLDSLFKVLTWSPEILDEETRGMIEQFTGGSYENTSTYVCANFPEELVAAAEGTQDPVGFFIAQGLVPEDIDALAPLSKLDAIQLLYGICAGTGARTTDKFGMFGSADVLNDYAEDAEVSGETFELIGESADNEIPGTSIITAHDGAQVTISDSTITSDHVVEGIDYQLAYRWGDGKVHRLRADDTAVLVVVRNAAVAVPLPLATPSCNHEDSVPVTEVVNLRIAAPDILKTDTVKAHILNEFYLVLYTFLSLTKKDIVCPSASKKKKRLSIEDVLPVAVPVDYAHEAPDSEGLVPPGGNTAVNFCGDTQRVHLRSPEFPYPPEPGTKDSEAVTDDPGLKRPQFITFLELSVLPYFAHYLRLDRIA